MYNVWSDSPFPWESRVHSKFFRKKSFPATSGHGSKKPRGCLVRSHPSYLAETISSFVHCTPILRTLLHTCANFSVCIGVKDLVSPLLYSYFQCWYIGCPKSYPWNWWIWINLGIRRTKVLSRFSLWCFIDGNIHWYAPHRLWTRPRPLFVRCGRY